MTESVKRVRVKFVAVISVLSLVAAFLASGVVSSTAAQAAEPTELTSFTFKSGTMEVNGPGLGPDRTHDLAGIEVTNGTFIVPDPNLGAFQFDGVTATATAMNMTVFDDYPGTLAGSNWRCYSGMVNLIPGDTLTFTDVNIENPPTPDPTPTPSAKKPRAPKSVKVAGRPSAKSFRVSWKAPSTKGNRPVTGYRVIIKARGAKKVAVNKKLSKKKRSYKVSRKTLLKSLRVLKRGEGKVRFVAQVNALNGKVKSSSTKRGFWVAP